MSDITSPAGFDTGQMTISAHPFMDKYTKPVKRSPREIVGRKNEMLMLEACLNRPELCNAMLLGEAGSGKCLENGTEIPGLFENGYKKIADLRPGDFVFDEKGEPVKVLGVFPQGCKRAYRVTFSDGTTIVCNDEHLWAARTRKQHYTGRDFQVHTLRDMMDYGLIHVTRGKRSISLKNWYVPCSDAVSREDADLPVHPYAVGAFIGDGCLTNGEQLEISSSDEPLVRHVAELIGAVDVVRNEHNFSWYFVRPEASADKKYIQRREFFNDPMFACMSGQKSIDRRIPEQYLLGSVEQRMELLRGLMDTDGTVSTNDKISCCFCTNSSGLVDDVRELAASLGIRTSMNCQIRNDDIHLNPEYEVHFILPDDEKESLFWLDRYREKLAKHAREARHFSKHYGDIAIATVEDLGYDAEMTCIYVDGESHLFLAGRAHIVTHNTMLVQGTMANDPNRHYVEVNLAKMIADYDPITLGNSLTQLFDEVGVMKKEMGKEVVLFIDEFHQIVQLSPAAVEAMKPLLADSGTRGVKVIAATTYEEFRKYIAPNQPLVERLQRINLTQPDKAMTVGILKGVAKTYGVDTQFYNDSMYETIYDLTNRYVPANSQPRKSILIMDAMVGYHRATGRPLDKKLLADVIYESEGVNIMFRVDAANIKKNLDAHVYAQELATSLITNRLHIAVADLNDKSKPMASFLFTGSTGVGKANACSSKIRVWTPDGSVTCKLAGEIVPGDYIFDREGFPTQVLGVFPQGKRDVYRVTLGDGRYLDVSDNHLWSVFPAKRARDEGYTIYETKTLLAKGLETRHKDRVGMKYFIPMNGAVQWPERRYSVDPYVVGVAIADGCMKEPNGFAVSSDDEFVIASVAKLIGASGYAKDPSCYTWCFYTGEMFGDGRHKRIQSKALFGDMPSLYNQYSVDRRIPKEYMTGSVEQRWSLVRGLFDCDGTICSTDGDRFNVSYSTHSKGLAYDIQELLYSLGIASSVSEHIREGKNPEYDVYVKVGNDRKVEFFTLPRKLEKAKAAAGVNKQREKTFDYVGIRSIEKLDYQEEMVCFYVDNDEHLYQAGQFIVTHNTEMTKQLASILFGGNSRDGGDENQSNNRNLIRFDMTEYANKESLERFRAEITARIWEHPYSVLLLDEIEKACAEVTRLLLQVLDDGRLSDENGRQVTFTNCYVILTTNAGSEIYRTISQYNASDTGDGSAMKRYNKLIRQSISQTTGDNRFPPELLGRIDAIIPFQPLSEGTMRKIVTSKLMKLVKEVSRKHNVELRIDKRVVDYLVLDNLDTDSNSGGARIVVTKMTEEVTTPVARFINENPDVRIIGVEVAGDMAWEHKDMLESSAYIKVAAHV